jgi:hypothetical protein
MNLSVLGRLIVSFDEHGAVEVVSDIAVSQGPQSDL